MISLEYRSERLLPSFLPFFHLLWLAVIVGRLAHSHSSPLAYFGFICLAQNPVSQAEVKTQLRLADQEDRD